MIKMSLNVVQNMNLCAKSSKIVVNKNRTEKENILNRKSTPLQMQGMCNKYNHCIPVSAFYPIIRHHI